MSRMYYASGTVASVASTKDLLEINAAADSVVILHELHVTNDTDETSEMIPMTIQRAGSSGSGGSTVTARPTEVGSVAYGGTIESGNTTQAGTLTELVRLSENILNGWHFTPVPEGRIVVSPSGRIIARLEASPTTSATYSFYALIEEIGG